MGRGRTAFYVDFAAAKVATLSEMPTLFCSLALSLKAAGAAGAVITQALASLGGGGAAHMASGHAADCSCSVCAALGRGSLTCAFSGCTRLGAKLKVCARCRRVAYCGAEHQAADWKRHKRQDECKKHADDDDEDAGTAGGSSSAA
jgi:hypothetical protein